MTGNAFDALTRSRGRRQAIQALAAAVATTLSGAAFVGAKSNDGNKNKKQNRKIKKKALALCAGQVTQCQALVGPDSAQLICCQELADCDFAGLIACLNAPAPN